MATQAEFGPHLRAKITPLITGVGPIEAAIGTTRALSQCAQVDALPALVVSLGSAGSAKLDHCGLYQAHSVSWRDMNAAPLGFAPGVTPFLDLPATLTLPVQIPGLPSASLSTGGDIVSGAAYEQIDADMVDMETYAVQRSCMEFAVPMIALRGISDGQSPLEGLQDWTQYLHVIDEKLAQAVDLLATHLNEML